jgi:hypothetical protein
MVHRISDILARFPESEQAVRQLIQQSAEFAALCQEYEDTRVKTHKSQKPLSPSPFHFLGSFGTEAKRASRINNLRFISLDPSRELGHFTTMMETIEADMLRKRSLAIEEEILTKIEGYQPA